MSLITEIDITRIVGSENFVPFDLANNRATLGDNAGQLTWQASKDAAEAIPSLLHTPEHKEAFRDWVQSSGGWTREEIDAWTDAELDALLLQWIAGDIREAFGDAEPSEWDWAQYEADASAGRISSNLFRTDDGRVYFTIHN
jgi:hypothetical protein